MLEYDVKCEVTDCHNRLRRFIAEGLKKQGKPAVCYEHRKVTLEDIEKMYGAKKIGV